MRNLHLPILFSLALVGLLGCQSSGPPLAVAEEVDLERYLGRWYEIASFPQRFQEGCVATTATYSRREDGRVRVVNECRDESFDGEVREIEGVAWLADPSENAKLKVQFFWPFSGAYWILEVDPEYGHAVVGHPSRDYLWILARNPTLAPETYAGILERVAAAGFDVERLNLTPQP
ncbi:MAG: lipocalin family protein [Myxococcota bacterium]